MSSNKTRRRFLQGGLGAGGALVTASLLSGRGMAQENSQNVIWELVEGGQGEDVIYDGVQMPDGVFIFVGQKENAEAGRKERWTLGIDNGGNVLFSEPGHFGGESSESLNAIVQVDDSLVFLAGKVSPDDGIYPAATLVSTEDGGSTVWNITPSRRGEMFSAIQTADDGFVIAGAVRNANTENQMGIMTKLDSEGSKEWELVDPKGGPSRIISVARGADNGYIGAGWEETEDGRTTGIVVKANDEGQEEWAKEFENLRFHSIAANLTEQGYLAAGERAGTGDSTRSRLVALDVNGAEIDEETYENVGIRSVRAFPEHDVYLLGGFIDHGDGSDGWGQGLQASREEIGTVTTNSDGDAMFNEVILTDDGSAAIGIGSVNTGEQGDQGLAVKFSEGGGEGSGTGSGRSVEGSRDGSSQRGFFSNNGDGPEWLSDAFNLTLLGFVLSVIGIVHQMVGGR